MGPLTVYTQYASFNDPILLTSGPVSVTAVTQGIGVNSITGNQDVSLSAPNQVILLFGDIGSSSSPIGNFSASSPTMGTGIILGGISVYALSANFNGMVYSFCSPNTIDTSSNGGSTIFTGQIVQTYPLTIHLGTGDIEFGGGYDAGNIDLNWTGTSLTLGGNLSTTSGGGRGNMNFTISGDVTFLNNAVLSTTGPAAISIYSTNGNLILGSGVTIQTVDGDILIESANNFISGADLTIQTTGLESKITLVTDTAYPTPPLFGSGGFTLLPATNLLSNTKVLLYSSVPIASSFPTMLNGVGYARGTYNGLNGVYSPGQNEFIGYWYNVPPFPPDPPYEVIFKGDPAVVPLITAIQQIGVAIVEPVTNAPQISSKEVAGTIPGQTLPSPRRACKGTPSVSIRVGL